MTPSEFDSLADAMLERIARAVEESGADCDCEPKGSGVLELEFADGSRLVVNRHSAARPRAFPVELEQLVPDVLGCPHSGIDRTLLGRHVLAKEKFRLSIGRLKPVFVDLDHDDP